LATKRASTPLTSVFFIRRRLTYCVPCATPKQVFMAAIGTKAAVRTFRDSKVLCGVASFAFLPMDLLHKLDAPERWPLIEVAVYLAVAAFVVAYFLKAV
jgi:hypothetical protein